jgi:hypothetical protein
MSIIRYTSAMIYSILVLDLCGFEAVGWKMQKGNTRIDGRCKRIAKMCTLCMLLEFGPHSEKSKAKWELHVIAFGTSAAQEHAEDVDVSNDDF